MHISSLNIRLSHVSTVTHHETRISTVFDDYFNKWSVLMPFLRIIMQITTLWWSFKTLKVSVDHFRSFHYITAQRGVSRLPISFYFNTKTKIHYLSKIQIGIGRQWSRRSMRSRWNGVVTWSYGGWFLPFRVFVSSPPKGEDTTTRTHDKSLSYRVFAFDFWGRRHEDTI